VARWIHERATSGGAVVGRFKDDVVVVGLATQFAIDVDVGRRW
jgi:hypothetical protein